MCRAHSAGTFNGNYDLSNAMPVVQQMFNIFSWPNKFFALWLNPATVNGTGLDPCEDVPGAYITVGGANPATYSGAISWVPAVTDESGSACGSGWWCVGMQGVSIAGSPDVLAGMCDGSGGCYAVVDSGTQTLSTSNYNAVQLCTAISSPANKTVLEANCMLDGFWAPNSYCDGTDGADKVITITLGGGNAFALPPAAYLRDVGNVGGPTTCLMLLGNGESSNTSWILGDTFLRWYTSVFDATNPSGLRVGFAQAKEGVQLGACTGE